MASLILGYLSSIIKHIYKKLKYVILIIGILLFIAYMCWLHIINHEPKRGGMNIFFIETSCYNHTEDRLVSPRQACAIESAAKAHQNHSIYVLHTCTLQQVDLPRDLEYFNQIRLLSNVHFLRINVNTFVENTPLETWWKTGGFKNSHFPVSHVSDVLRLLTLWKYGGTYMDLDFIVFKSFNGLSNFIGAETHSYVGCSMINVNADGIGHEFITDCLQEMRLTFDGTVWAHNGPFLVTRVLEKWCNISEVEMMTKDRCRGFTVLPPRVIYPISYASWRRYFDDSPLDSGNFKDSLAIHLWNKLSKDTPVIVGSNQTYGLLAEKYCPEVYGHCGSTF